MVTDFEILDKILVHLKNNQNEQHVSLKVVIFNDEDYEFAKKIHQRYPDVPFFFQVGNDDITTMDNAQLISKLLQKYEWLINKVISDGEVKNAKVLPQLHTYIWGNKRGV